jgi:hypothetical protein
MVNGGQTRIYNSDGSDINLDDSDDNLVFVLQQLIKRVESLATVDISKRQRVALDSVTAIINTLGIAVTGATSGAGVSAPNPVSPNAPTTIAGATVYYQPVWVGPVDQRWLIKDQARNTYANAIRSNLV